MENHNSGDNSALVAIVAIAVIAGLAIIFFMYALPMMQKPEEQQPGINITVPTNSTQPPPSQQPSY